jgi:hypothetical protein
MIWEIVHEVVWNPDPKTLAACLPPPIGSLLVFVDLTPRIDGKHEQALGIAVRGELLDQAGFRPIRAFC